MSDEEIIELFHSERGEDQAFRMLIKEYGERLYWHIRKIVISHEDSNDILQNVFVKIWKGIEEFRYEAKLFTWMYKVATMKRLIF